jgi:hypothetical protein
MRPGAKIGIHAEQASQAVPLMEKFKAAGVEMAGILAMENPGLSFDAKRIFPNITTVTRWHNPNHEYEGGGQQMADWPENKRLDFARKAIDLIFTRTNEQEYQASDYFCPGLNEWDPPGVGGWQAMGEILLLLCQEATNRSPEMERLGRHSIRLAIPGFNNGTPEWDEFLALKATGIFDVMKARGDILIVHEGLWWNEPMNSGVGDLIPGAPRVPTYGGSKIGRVNYWYELLGLDIPFMVSEWYDGGTADFTPPATRVAYIANYDRLMRHNKNYLAVCPFEMTDLEAGPWTMVDFTAAMFSPEMLAYMQAEKNKPNPIGDDDMQPLDEATRKEVRERALAIRAEVDAILAAVDPKPKHTMRDKTNQDVINTFARAFGKLPKDAPPYIAAIARANLNAILPSGTARLALYSGVAIEDMTGLTEAERGALVAALG